MVEQASNAETSEAYTSKYVAVHKLLGLASLETAEFEIKNAVVSNVRFVLAEDIEKYLELKDEREAIAPFLFSHLFGASTAKPPFKTVADATKNQKAQRQNKKEKGVFLIILGRQDNVTIDVPVIEINGHKATLKNHVLEIETIAAIESNKVFASVILSSSSDWSAATEKIFELSFLEDTKNNRIHLYEINVGVASLTVSGIFKQKNREELDSIFESFANEDKLSTPIKLFVESLNTPDGDLRRDLASWAALEILVNKIFDEYRAEWDATLRRSVPPSGERYFNSVQRIMDGKFNLLDKFVVISSILDSSGAKDDIETFRQAKKTRDEFYHALESTPNAASSSLLFRKYLKLHFQKQVHKTELAQCNSQI